MHESIIKKFKKYYIFGFTGTPIFPENAATYGVDKQSGKAMLQTTQSTFGECLHSYTILNAIRDKNVLPFKVSYHSTTTQSNPQEKKVKAINTEEALMSKERIQQIVSYILENFNRHTKRQNAHALQNQRLKGFNAIFATSSVEAVKRYYAEFMRQIKVGICHYKPSLEGEESLKQSQDSANQDREFLKIGIIYSYEPNEDLDELDELEDPCSDKRSAKEFLRSAIEDYNAHFKSNFSLESFDSYYKDISQKSSKKS